MKCLHCLVEQLTEINIVVAKDATTIFDGKALCADHLHDCLPPVMRGEIPTWASPIPAQKKRGR